MYILTVVYFFLICHFCVAWDLLKMKCCVVSCFTVNKVKLTSLSFRAVSCHVICHLCVAWDYCSHVMSISQSTRQNLHLCILVLWRLCSRTESGAGVGVGILASDLKWKFTYVSEFDVTAAYVHSWIFRSWWSFKHILWSLLDLHVL